MNRRARLCAAAACLAFVLAPLSVHALAGEPDLTSVQIELADLPSGVQEYISKQNPGATIEEASKVTDIYGVVSYEVEVADVDFFFSSTGQFISQEKEADDKK